MESRLLLIRPTFGSRFQITPPLPLGYIASNLKKNGFSDIKIIDGTLYELSAERMADIVFKENADFVGIQVYTGSQNWTRRFIQLLDKSGKKIISIVGGPHISALKAYALNHISADFGIIGEGEESFVMLVQKLVGQKNHSYDEIPGLIWKDKDEYKISSIPFARILDLDTLPSPDYDLMNITKYYSHMEGASVPLKGRRPVPILSSRGCPYQCTFCSSKLTFLKKIRYRTIEKVIQELEYLKSKYHIDEFFVTDDNLTFDMERAEKFFDLLISKKLNLYWRAPNGLRADRLNENLIRKMKQCGCYFVGIGVETGSIEIMKTVKKSLDLNKIREILPFFNKYKILTSGFFMVGLPNETKKDVEKTVDFIKKSKFDRIQVSIYTPYPGSEDFDKIFGIGDDEVYKKNIEDYLYRGKIPKVSNYLSFEQIHSYQKKMMMAHYLKPRVIFNLLKNIKLSQVKAALSHPMVGRWYKKEHSSFLDDIR